jgi:phospholipid/cholesterol/gamma-HCH transport system substrate-binding protein
MTMGPVTRRKTEIWVGIFVLLSMGVMFFVTLFLAGEQRIFAEKVEVRALFDDIQGLREGAPVLIAGLQCGTVRAIEFTKEGRLLVIMEVERHYLQQIRKDSIAQIGTIGLLGDKSVRISTGTRGAPPIKEGDLIPTKHSLTLEDVAEKASPIFDSLGKTLENLQVFTSRLMDTQRSFNKDLETLDEILSNIREGEGTLGKLLKRGDLYDALVANLEEINALLLDIKTGKGTLGKLVEDPQLYQETLQAVRGLNETTMKAKEVAESLKKTIEVGSLTMGEVKTLISSLSQVVEKIDMVAQNLEQSSLELPLVFKDIRQLIQDTDRGVIALKELIDAVQEHWLIRPYLKEPEPVFVTPDTR